MDLFYTCARGLMLVVLAAYFGSLTACASGRAHQNFKNIMQLQVGKPIGDPYLTRNEYPRRRVASRVLSNGNVEEEFQAGRALKCRVFFEIDTKAKKIVGWRYEGSEEGLRDRSLSDPLKFDNSTGQRKRPRNTS